MSQILTKAYLNELNNKYKEQQKEIKRKLNLIMTGVPFGILADYAYDGYYPCEFKKILEEETGLILVYEPSIDKTHSVHVLDLFIEGDTDVL